LKCVSTYIIKGYILTGGVHRTEYREIPERTLKGIESIRET